MSSSLHSYSGYGVGYCSVCVFSRHGWCVTGRRVPQGLAAVGWRIGVYWREDHKFYLGELASYNDEEDLYEMNYDDSKLPTAACVVPMYVRSAERPGN